MSKAKILIVEDEAIVALDIQNRLSKEGYDVVGIAATGEEAITIASSTRPQLALMDIRLQGDMDGTETAEHLQSKFGIPIIYLTAHSDAGTVLRAKATEPFGYLLKPFKDKELETMIEIALYKYQMEAKLRQSEHRFATTLKSIGDAVIATDEQGRVTFMNPVAEALTGWPQEEATGKDIDKIFDLIHEETREAVESPVRRAIQQNKSIKLANHTLLISKNKKTVPIEDSAAPIKDDEQKITGVVLVFKDVTERKEAAEALRRAEEQLFQLQKMDAIGRLAGGIAHDFNNLLTAILGYSELLLIKTRESDPNYSNIQEIRKAGERATALTNQLLAFSRKQMLQPKVLDLNSIIANMESLLYSLIREDIYLTFSLEALSGKVKVDLSQLEQVIMNLVINARDAMPAGGRLRIETQNVELNSSYVSPYISVPPGPYVLLAVTDTGQGMDKKTQEMIFEPFFTTKDQGKGTGLGLSMIYGIVKQSGGSIWVYSKPDQGTTFKIYLPRVDELADTIQSKIDIPHLIPGDETVLVVEDEDIVRNLIRTVLETAGYTVLDASKGSEALEIYRHYKGKIDIMITDVVMPEMSGRELADKIIQLRPHLPILFMSGYTDDAIIRHGVIESGGNFIQKPFSPDVMVQKVREILGKKRPVPS